jgi:hypothetical protein
MGRGDNRVNPAITLTDNKPAKPSGGTFTADPIKYLCVWGGHQSDKNFRYLNIAMSRVVEETENG